MIVLTCSFRIDLMIRFFANIFFQESKFGPEQEMQTSLKTIACLTTPNFELKKKYQQKLTNLYNAHDYL